MKRTVEVGFHCTLTVGERGRTGVCLSGERGREVLLPFADLPEGMGEGDELSVFIFTDAHGEPMATVGRAKASLGQFAVLECMEVNEVGAFLDWGICKELFVPFSHQHVPMSAGRSYVVFVCLDKAERLMGTSKLARCFDYKPEAELQEGDSVSLMVYGRRDNAVLVVVDRRFSGVIFADRGFRRLVMGAELSGFVREVREDNRVEVVLTQAGKAGVDAAVGTILGRLRDAGGRLEVNDKSAPEVVLGHFGMSKKAFKRAVGNLLKRKKIRLIDGGIEVVGPDGAS